MKHQTNITPIYVRSMLTVSDWGKALRTFVKVQEIFKLPEAARDNLVRAMRMR